MNQTVYILATVRNAALLEATRLVFRTLRIGFPDANVQVYGNGLEWADWKEIGRCCQACGASLTLGQNTSHDAWVEKLIQTQTEPFWICDTDVVFFGEVASVKDLGAAMCGELEPEFSEEWTGTIHVERLHTCVMWIDPTRVRMAMRQWMSKIPLPWGATAQMNLVRQMFVPSAGNRTLFYDTTAGLWQAGIGTALTQTIHAWEHLHCGTYADEVSSGAPGLKDMAGIHQAIYAEPARARGLRAKQAEYYRSRAVGASERQSVRACEERKETNAI